MAFVTGWQAGSLLRGSRVPQIERRAARQQVSRNSGASRLKMVEEKTKIEPEKNDLLLAELRFSDPSKLPNLIVFKKEQLNDAFFQFMNQKIKELVDDQEEKENLVLLKEAILDILKRTEGATMPGEVEVEVSTVTPEKTYEDLYETFVSFDGGLQAAVTRYYERVDKDFLDLLAKKAVADAQAQELQTLIFAQMELVVRRAQESLAMVLKAPNMGAMMDSLEELYEKGRLDESFLLLLRANLEQAKQAGVENAVKLLTRVQQEALSLIDDAKSAELKLIRVLLRESDVSRRRQVLVDAFRQKATGIVDDTAQAATSAVDGKEFVKMMAKLMQDFGNVKEELRQQLTKIGEEAEEVAREVLGLKDKDIRELQDESFQKKTMSVFELEQIEMQSEMMGTKAPWEESQKPPGFDESGKMVI